MTDSELSDAVVAYLGYRTAAIPRRDGDAVAPPLVTRVIEVIDESGRIPVDWPSVDSDLQRGTAAFRTAMADRRPDLTAEALDALAWMFSWEWR